MKILATMVHDDEPCHGLREETRLMTMEDGSSEWRWVQTVFVIRGDAIAAYTTDYGPAENFKLVTPLLMPSFGDDTVAQLREYAERNRHDTYWQQRAAERLAQSTLIRDHIEQLDMKRQFILRNPRTAKEIIDAHRN